MRIYLDTCIWNALLKLELGRGEIDRTPIPCLAISRHVVYELGGTFQSNPDLAKLLFRNLIALFDAGVQIANEPFNLIIQEMHAVRDSKTVEFTWPNRRDFRAELVRLADGNTHLLQAFIEQRQKDALKDQDRVSRSLQLTNGLTDELKRINRADLPTWIDIEMKTEGAYKRLLEKLQTLFPEQDRPGLCEWAHALLHSSRAPVTAAALRMDLYYNWCSARREKLSPKKDLMPDAYHIINALYCSAYVTGEPDQAKYALLLGMPSSKIHIWERNVRIDHWLSTMVTR